VLRNIDEGDGVLVLKTPGESPGTAFTKKAARIRHKAFFIADPFQILTVKDVVDWVEKNDVYKITIAGPRESKCPGIYFKTKLFVHSVLTQTIIRGIIKQRNHSPYEGTVKGQ
jgi:hypothetical protein